MIDYKALKGDPTDNIPGVPGVGEKTAAKLIREYGTLEALYERIAEVKPDKLREKLIEHRDSVFMGKDLSTIVRDLPVDARPRRGPPRRLRPRDGHPALPRVRVPLAHRAPAADVRRDAPARRPRRCAGS